MSILYNYIPTKTKRPRLVFHLVFTKPLRSNDKEARTGDIQYVVLLVKSREMKGRIQTQSWWLKGEGVKTTEKKHWPRWAAPKSHGKDCSQQPVFCCVPTNRKRTWGLNSKELLRNKLRVHLRLSCGSVHGSFCSNIELAGLTWARFSVPILCVCKDGRGLRSASGDRTPECLKTSPLECKQQEGASKTAAAVWEKLEK